MKIIHCADLHLDSRMETNLTREQARTRKMEILRTFTRMVEYAASNGVRVILIAGDLFDTRNISSVVRNQVKDMIRLHPDIDFLYLRGNHDEDNFLSELEEVPPNLILFGNEWRSCSYGRVTISGLELGQKGENRDALYHSLLLDPGCFNIVMLHGQATDYRNPSDPLNISLRELKGRFIDYLALGHVHEYSFGQLDTRGYYAYPGCLEGRGFDECEEHGFIQIDIDEQTLRPSYCFVPMAYRTLYSLNVDLTGAGTTQEAASRIEEILSRGDYAHGSLVRFVLEGCVDVDAEINFRYLEQQFSEYFFYVKLENKTRLRVEYHDFEKDASLKGEFIRMVLGSDLKEDQKNAVIRCGINALAGEEILP